MVHVKELLEKHWMNVINKKGNVQFWRHEWDTHGKCILPQDLYFEKVIDLFQLKSLRTSKSLATLSEEMQASGITVGIPVPLSTVQNFFDNFHASGVQISCEDDGNSGFMVWEIKMCVFVDGFINCGTSSASPARIGDGEH